jgi:cysteine-rich repeat protein
MKQFVLIVVLGVSAIFLLTGTAMAVCGDTIIDPGEECDDGDTNDYNACRNDCTNYTSYFNDLTGSEWFFEYAQRLYEYSISQGYGDGTYKPFNTVNRAEMSAFVIRAIDSMKKECPGNDSKDIMVRVGPICVDKYEASVWGTPTGSTQYGASSDNYPCSDNGNDCSSTNPIYARSEAGVTPSNWITWFQAQQACAMSGKRLLTNAEWQMAAAGTLDPGFDDDSTTTCATNSELSLTGSRTNCVSNWEVNDMVGNLWEWVADWMQDNSDSDNGSIASATYGIDGIYGVDEATPEADRFPGALLRGGDAGLDTDAGVFALYAFYGPSHSGSNIGFRCAR